MAAVTKLPMLTGQHPAVLRIVLAAALLLCGLLFEDSLHSTAYHSAEYLVYLTAYLLVGYPVLRSAGRKALRGDVLDENSLMTIATFGAIAIHQLAEAVAVMLFYAVGEALQEMAVNRSRRSISALLDIRPDRARVQRNNELVIVHPTEVSPGETLQIHPGERIPLDGEITEGESLVDTSAITGESMPRQVVVGHNVLAGMVVTNHIIRIQVTKPYSASAIARILQLVEEAAERKAHTERVITTFSRYYTPAVVALALGLAILPPLLLPGAEFATWLYRALVLLVISCPCALVVSVPLGYFGGIGASSRHGILVKGAGYIDTLAKLSIIAVDKTGTLTKGVFSVSAVNTSGTFTREEVLAAAASVETPSSHPIAASILAAQHVTDQQPQPQNIADYAELAGLGVKGTLNGRVILAGNDRLLHHEGVLHPEAACAMSGTVVQVAIGGIYAGNIVIADEIRPDAPAALAALHKLAIRRIVMLTGDDMGTAEKIGRKLGIDAVYANLLPEDKVRQIETLTAEKPAGRYLAFVGDGINDAPVLSRADVGIAMGGLGSDAAIEAADVVILEDKLTKLPVAIRIARRTRRIVKQNIAFALGVKSLFMALGAVGLTSIWGAVFADVGVSFLAILNATRTLRTNYRE